MSWKKIYFIIIVFAFFLLGKKSHAQVQINSEEFDTYISDTLLLEPSEIEKVQTLTSEVQKTLTFKPKTDGFKTYYFISGKKYSAGFIKEKKPDGNWISWYENGKVNKKIIFNEGKREGPYESWYENGNKNASGQYIDDAREGKWVFYKEDGSLMGNYEYKDGKLLSK